MKRLFYAFILSLTLSAAYASGGITHMFIASEVINQLPDVELRNLIKDNYDAYLVGAYYPDSGYVAGTHYGEDSHWDPFIDAFADHLKEKYPQPELQNSKLVAFLLGCAVHRVSDEIMHWTFYPVMGEKDFGTSDWSGPTSLHLHGDFGIDLLLLIDKNQWFTQPLTWWLPVNDLVAIYHRMGKEYTAREIIWGNAVIFFAGHGERFIAAAAYPYLQWKMPWTAKHYYDWPVGGIQMDEQNTADYLMKLWAKLKDHSPPQKLTTQPAVTLSIPAETEGGFTMPAAHFAETALQNGFAAISIQTNQDGSIELQPPVITSFIKIQQSINDLLAQMNGKGLKN